MIQQLSIRNFKSIRALDLDCRRVNVLIGEPNVGKTNILEALALRSADCLPKFREVLRVSLPADLYSDQDVSGELSVTINGSPMILRTESDKITGYFQQAEAGGEQAYLMTPQLDVMSNTVPPENVHFMRDIRYYLFKPLTEFEDERAVSLVAPFGENLSTLLYSSKAARLTAAGFFHNSGFSLNVDLGEKRLKVVKQVDGFLISLPYHGCSETLRRMVFYTLALDTNRDRILLFDEPEAHSFPPYTKTLAERIALDDRGNQFFLTTHSPYMLDSLLSKTPASDLNVILCRMEQFETRAYPLNQQQIDRVKEWSMDAFFNFDRLIPELE